MSNDEPKQHPRKGYRKPGAKRATLALRITDEAKAMIQQQAAHAERSVSDHIVAMAEEYQFALASACQEWPEEQ